MHTLLQNILIVNLALAVLHIGTQDGSLVKKTKKVIGKHILLQTKALLHIKALLDTFW